MQRNGACKGWVWFLILAGCTGQIGDRSGAGLDRGSGGPSTGGWSTTGMGSATGATGGTVPPGARDPGRVTIRRLNRTEYDNTVHDLLGTTQTPGMTTFPDDAPAIGFDNIGDLQTLSPVQFALYQQAAEALAAEAMTAGSSERAKLVTCDLASGTTCREALITNFGQRAFRRPLSTTEVSAYAALMATAAKAGATADEQFRTVIEAMLVSPHFLYRPEFDPDPASRTPHLLGPYETASRLSYMVYRSMPDQRLFDAVASGALSRPSDVQAELQRMLADAKGAFADTFASQWLGSSVVVTETFDPKLFPKFNPALANSMSLEVTSFLNEFVQKNNAVQELLTAKFSYIDDNLAALYGIPAVSGGGLVRTTLGTTQRGGILTMGGILAVTSHPTRTSVVRRGAWVLGQLLCSAPPAPPPNVPPFPEGPMTGTTQKQILAQHRANPACAVCHDSMDNIGVAMENYDATGAYRTVDNGVPIDAAGMFSGPIAAPPGVLAAKFTGAQELAGAVAVDPRFAPCVAENVLVYSLGRALLATDRPYLADISQAARGALGFRDVLMNVVASDTFRMRRGD
jgi:hypothetical protein